jgi:thiol-disulfide isomerase/thioredoxin
MLKLTRRTALAAGWTLMLGALARKPAGAQSNDMLPLDLYALQHGPPGPRLPGFDFVTEAGEKRTLADYAGRGIVLNFWATWCGPCVKEMPALDQLARAVADDHIAVLPLSSDRAGAAAVEAFYKEQGIRSLPVLLDPEGAAARAVGARGIPTTVILDGEGRERQRVEGAVDWSKPDVMAALRKAIGRD